MRVALTLAVLLVAGALFWLVGEEGDGRRSTRPEPAAPVEARAAAAGDAPADEQRIRVIVHVRDEEGKAVAGARVSLDDERPPEVVETDANGDCELLVPHDAWIGIFVRHPDFLPGADWSAAHVTERTIVLQRGTQFAVLVLAPDRRPLAGARVRAARRLRYGISGMWSWEHSFDLGDGVTGADGRARLGGVPVARLTLHVDHQAYAPRLETVDIVSTAPVEHVVVLDEGGAITGRVTGPDDEPVEGARVRTADLDRPETRSAADGTYRLAGVGSRPVRLVATADGHGPGFFGSLRGWDEPLPVTVAPGDVIAGVDIRLGRPSFVTGRIVDDAGAPVAGVAVTVSVHGNFVDPPPAKTDAEGRFRAGPVAVLEPGRVGLQVDARGHGHPTFHTKQLEPGRDLDLGDVVLTRLGVIRGKVLGTDGQPAAGASVRLDQDPGWWRTGPDGAFEVARVRPGPTFLLASSPAGYAHSPQLSVEAGQTLTGVTLQLEPPAPIAGRVITPDGKPRDGVVLAIQPVDGAPAAGEPTAVTDADGRFVFSVAPGRYRLGLSEDDKIWYGPGRVQFREEPAPMEVAAGREDIEFVYPYKGGVITGQVVSRHTGLPLREFTASFIRYKFFIPRDGDFDFHQDEKGRFRYETDEPGTWQVEVSAPDHAPHRSATFALKAGEHKDVGQIRLGIGGTLRGSVKDAQGAPVPYVRVNILNAKFQTNDEEPFTDREGRFVLERIAPGPYTVFAVSTRHPLGMERNVVVREAETTVVTVRLQDPAPLTILVTDPSGDPVPDAEFSFSFAAVAPLTSKVFRGKIPPGCGTHYSDAEGVIRQLCLPPGAVSYTVEAKGFKTVNDSVRLQAGEPNRIRVRLERE